jgi:PAS domain S-box-containing protein
LAVLQPTLDRAARIAKTLMGAADATVVLLDGRRAWLGEGRGLTEGDLARFVARSGKLLWIEDISLDRRFKNHPAATTGEGFRFYAGAPVRLADGDIAGVLCVVGRKPKAFDQTLADRLVDLAVDASEACERAHFAEVAAKTKRELEASHARFRALLEKAPAALAMLDNDMCVMAATSLWLEAYGTTDAQAIGRSFYDIDPTASAYRKAFDRALAGASIEIKPMTDVAGNWLKGGVTPWRTEAGEIGGLLIAYLDVTELVNAQDALIQARDEAEAANRAKSAFLATMSHEIRTPLNGVLGMTQALIAGAPDPLQRQQLNVIQQSGETLLAILNDVLDLSKIEAGKLELEEIEFDLGDVARGVEAVFSAQAAERGLAFSMTIEGAEGAYRGDPTRLRQILYNLISNAVKFTADGGIKVRAWRREGWLSFEVADTGIGMSPKVVAGLFEKFSQADASTTRRFGGTGLGLAICQQLAALMGGWAKAESVEGKGSTFTVELRMACVAPGQTGGRLDDAPAEPRTAEPLAFDLRVLAAEDNAINQLVLKTLLNQIGVDPILVGDGVQAVAAWEAEHFDLVLMDVQMPGMDGLTAARLIRRREAESGRATTPIIALTANALSHQIEEYLAAGMNGCVTKPIEVKALFEACETVRQPSAAAARA